MFMLDIQMFFGATGSLFSLLYFNYFFLFFVVVVLMLNKKCSGSPSFWTHWDCQISKHHIPPFNITYHIYEYQRLTITVNLWIADPEAKKQQQPLEE
jgi:hypothetical protein